MKTAAALLLGGALLAGCSKGESTNTPPPVAAASTAPSGAASSAAAVQALPGDTAAGGLVATQGLPTKGVAACSGCHGAKGEGNAAAGFPRLAGQSQAYLMRELQAYADGRRANPVMMPIAKGLTDAQRRDVAAYYETQLPTASSVPAGTAASGSERGQTLAVSGDDALHVQACANCHGPQGIGEVPTYPALAGQGSTYLVNALKAWKDGSRKTDPSQQMPMIAKALSDADITEVAQYYASQTLPQPPAATSSSTTPPAASSSSGPRANAGTAQGIGVEQGSPTTGGSQGPGGGGGTNGPQPQQNSPQQQHTPLPPRPMGKR